MTVEASSSKCAHPPRSNRPRSSSSCPPGPCMTPSTETCAVVVSFMVAVPFSLGFVVVRLDRTAAPISPVAAESVRPIHSAPSPTHGQRRRCRTPEPTPRAAAKRSIWRFPVGGTVEPAPHHLSPGLRVEDVLKQKLRRPAHVGWRRGPDKRSHGDDGAQDRYAGGVAGGARRAPEGGEGAHPPRLRAGP